jgi:hypothetical protein
LSENILPQNLSPQLVAVIDRIQWLTTSKFLRQEKSYLVFQGKAGEIILLPNQFSEPPAFIPQQEDELDEDDLDDEAIFY